MSAPVIIPVFGPNGEPFTLERLNEAFAALVAAINALAAQQMLQLGGTPGNNAIYMPVTGGSFHGQITAPSILVGPPNGVQHRVVTTNDAASKAVAGVVRMAEAVSDLGATVSDPPAQAEVQAIADKIDELLAALRATGILETSGP